MTYAYAGLKGDDEWVWEKQVIFACFHAFKLLPGQFKKTNRVSKVKLVPQDNT